MNVKILRTNDSDSAVARIVSNMMLDNYKKGIAIANHEFAEENGIADSVGVIDPTQTVRVRKQKSTPITAPVSKGYNIKAVNATDVTKTSTNAGSQQAKEFILQSKTLDNEIDHVLALLKLNNKDEFYKNGRTGDVDAGLYKGIISDLKASKKEEAHVKELGTEINRRMAELHQTKKDYQKYIRQFGEDDEDQEEEIENMEAELEEHVKELDDILSDLPKNSDIIESLIAQGKTVDRVRNKRKGEHHQFTNMKEDAYKSTLSGANEHLKSKNGVRVVNTIQVEDFSQDLLLVIKKISSLITTTLMPLAQKMHDTRFLGITLQDKNVVVPELYQDMDEKMYILISLNNQSNTQLMKLDKDFDKLYNLVNNGLSIYVMPTGGSMTGGHIRSSTNYLYEL